MKKNQQNSQTAYEYNAHSSVSDEQVKDHGWSDAINRMIDQRYAFLDMQYEEGAYLFRGMSEGLFDALLINQFWHYNGNDRGNVFEKEQNILLVSQDFSDAYTVSKMWEQQRDACILIIKSDQFNYALSEKNAAMMATAEPGVVFKYPFFSNPFTLQDIEFLVITGKVLDDIKINSSGLDDVSFKKLVTIIDDIQALGKLIVCSSSNEEVERSQFEKLIIENLSDKGITGANVIKSDLKPTSLQK